MDPRLLVGLLAGARVWALLRVQPSWQRALGRQWQWQALLVAGPIALILATRSSPSAPPELESLAVLVLALAFELLLGTVLGMLAALPGHALVGASDQMSARLGLDASQPSLARVVVMASLAFGLGLGLHAPLLAGLVGVGESLPLGRPEAWLAPLLDLDVALVVDAAIRMTALALALATPVLLTEMLASLALATLVRAEACADVLAEVLGPGLRFASALLALGAAWSAYPEAFARGM